MNLARKVGSTIPFFFNLTSIAENLLVLFNQIDFYLERDFSTLNFCLLVICSLPFQLNFLKNKLNRYKKRFRLNQGEKIKKILVISL